MAQYQGLTAEMYRAVVAIVDDRMKEIRVVRQEFDRLVEAHARTEAALNRLSEAQARTEAALKRLSEAQERYREASEARFARIEATLNRLSEAQAQTEARLRELAEAQAQTEARLRELAEAQAQTEARVRELAEAQARTEEEFRKYREASEARFARIEATLNRLSEAQARTEEEFRKYREASEARFARIEAALDRLAEAQARTEEEFRKYREASEARFARIEAVLEQVVVQLQKLTDRTGKLEGRLLELTYQQKAGSYFGHLLRRPRALLPAEIEDQLEGRITQEEFRELLAVDLLVSGRPRHLAEAPQVWLVVEISATVDRHDVERARQRADLLRRAGLRAIPTVAGEDATMGALEEAKTHKVLMLQDGRSWFWEEALAEVLQ
jgi:predicted  nucleic acid-binding Zn-ribbon protein